MLSHKNKNKSFVFEEEFDQENTEKLSIKNESIRLSLTNSFRRTNRNENGFQGLPDSS